MNREELEALHAALGEVLSWPDSVRDQVAAWLGLRPGNGLDPDEASAPGQPAAAKPNGLDPHPPRQAKIRKPVSAFATKTAEQRLIQAMRDNPGASVNVLAKAAGANRSSTGERLRALAGRGAVEKDPAGRWRIAEEKPPVGGESRPMQPPAG